MLQTFLTGLREGLEAALIVGILVAYLHRSGRADFLSAVWAGVTVAVASCLGVGALLTFTSHSLSDTAEPAFAGIMSVLAVALVTWMVFWMRTQATLMKNELQAKIDRAATVGWWAIAFAAFLAVGREGLETALFLWPTIKAAGSETSALVGAMLGIVASVIAGYLIYKRVVTLNLAIFFKVTGIALIVIASGVLAYGVSDLQEAGFLPGASSIAFDVSQHIRPEGWFATLLKGTISFSPTTTWLQLMVHVSYLAIVMVLFLRPTASTVSMASTAEVEAVEATDLATPTAPSDSLTR